MNTGDAKSFVKDTEARINELIEQKKWLEAHKICLEVLRFAPDNIKIIRIKNKIEKTVTQINQDALKEDIYNLKPLLREGRFDELLPNLEKLRSFANEYPPLRKFIYEADKAYKKHISEEKDEYVDQEIKHVDQLASTNEFEEAIKIAEKLRKISMRDVQLRKIIANLRERWIDYELGRNKDLLESKNYEEILVFYQGMLNIDYKSKKVQKNIQNVKKEYKEFLIFQQKTSVKKAMDRIKTMYKLGKYDLLMDTAKEILDLDPSNREAKKFFKKAEKKARKIQDKDIQAQMKIDRNQTKEDYKKDKKKFIKI
jgi:tetratricopeptide (TPR) repeat protein